MKKHIWSTYNKILIKILILLIAGTLVGCQAFSSVFSPASSTTPERTPYGMTEEEAATLLSLEKVDDYPLYTMIYQADYEQEIVPELAIESIPLSSSPWACSLFAAMGNPEGMVFGRNFDWEFSPALLLFTDPVDGYASVSMVDIAYLGFGDELAHQLMDLSLGSLTSLLNAPYLPFDGMNEAGLAVGMAAVPPGRMESDPNKKTIGSLLAIRTILDQAATVAEAVSILESFNLDMGDVPIHYLIADKTGKAVLVEFSWGEMKVIPNEEPWHLATNFLISESWHNPEEQCWRYAMMSEVLVEREGKLSQMESMDLLDEVSQEGTQWSITYEFTTGNIQVVMDQKFQQALSFSLLEFIDTFKNQ